MDQTTLEPDPYKVVLYGEFTATGNRTVRYAVSLTGRDLTVQRITDTPDTGRNKLVLSLKDCIGCRAFRDENTDTAAYFSAFFYPFKRRGMCSGLSRWMCSGAPVSRQRVEQSFRVEAAEDARANLEEAERWARAVRESAARQQHLRNGVLSQLPRPCRLLLLVNPRSGKGVALGLFTAHVQRMLSEAGATHTLVLTERQNHARELVREADLSQWDALVILSGDGLLFEVVNGLMERADWAEAIQTPLGILPGGSGNALAASLHHYSGCDPVSSEALLLSCGFLLCRGAVRGMDLCSVRLASGPRLFSFLSLAWGFVADVDLESEKYRWLGAARFTLGALLRLASLRVYRGRLAYLPTAGGARVEGQSSNNALRAEEAHPAPGGPADPLLAPLDRPVPSDWVTVEGEEFVLVLAVYQSHLAQDMLAAPGAALEDESIHLFYVTAGVSRLALLRLFVAMETGAHLSLGCPHLVHARVRALRLEPLCPPSRGALTPPHRGALTVDGEAVECGAVQAQMHRGMARMISG